MFLRIFILFTTLQFALVAQCFSNENKCSVYIQKAKIINSEFHINFEPIINDLLIKKGYEISQDASNSNYVFLSRDFITVSNNFFKLQQANLELKILKSKDALYTYNGMKNCFTVSCPAAQYAKALKIALKNLDKNLPHCQ